MEIGMAYPAKASATNTFLNVNLCSTSDLEDAKELFRQAVKNYRELQEIKSITLRVNKEDLIRVNAKARKEGLAYQTLVNLLIHQYAKGEKEVIL